MTVQAPVHTDMLQPNSNILPGAVGKLLYFIPVIQDVHVHSY